MIIEPGVYIDKPTGAILLILGVTRIGPSGDDPNYLDMIDLVVLDRGSDPHEWEITGARIQCMEEIFDDSSRATDGKMAPRTCLERII